MDAIVVPPKETVERVPVAVLRSGDELAIAGFVHRQGTRNYDVNTRISAIAAA